MFPVIPLEISMLETFLVAFGIPAAIFAAVVLFFLLIVRLIRRLRYNRLERGYKAEKEAKGGKRP